MIIQRHRSGKPLGYAAVRRDNPALVSAAEAYFGSWLCMRLESTLICILTVSGASEQCPPKEIV
jgi:hypothetical protein